MDDELIEELLTLQGESSFLYLATPYTKHPGGIEQAFDDACIAAAVLVERGVRVYCPIAHTHSLAGMSSIDHLDHAAWLRLDYPFMVHAAGLLVVTMPGWQDSHGIAYETEVFVEQGKQIHYLPWPLEESEAV